MYVRERFETSFRNVIGPLENLNRHDDKAVDSGENLYIDYPMRVHIRGFYEILAKVNCSLIGQLLAVF